MENPDQIKDTIRNLLETQRLGVLSTQAKGEPHASLVAFVVAEDLKSIVFATPRTTRKYANLEADSRAALLVDNRANQASDFRTAMAVTAKGSAAETFGTQREKCLELYLAVHPHLEDFVKSPSCALMLLKVETYQVVRRFQSVMELHITQ
jgi:nitroimidazol reductase NimA-like FMN-containing flavoprotein (pyridoxamine 5'-phosphate oxidase superfamily)